MSDPISRTYYLLVECRACHVRSRVPVQLPADSTPAALADHDCARHVHRCAGRRYGFLQPVGYVPTILDPAPLPSDILDLQA